jgi:hypothetical protein
MISMFGRRKAQTYQVAEMLAQQEIYRRQGEQPVTVEQMDRDDFLGVHIPSEFRASVAPHAHTQVKHVFRAED